MKILFRWIMNAAALLLLTKFLPGINVDGWYAAFVAALILGLINAVIRPIIVLLTLPLNLLTLGLFTFVINALLFWLAASVVDGFAVAGFIPAFVGALVMTIVSAFTGMLLKKD